MPRTNLCKSLHEQDERNRNLMEVLLKYRNRMDLKSWKQSAPICGFTISTFSNRIQAPGDFTRDEMHRVIKGLHIPDEEIRPYL